MSKGVGGTWLKRQIDAGEEHHDGALTVDIDDDGDMDIISQGWMHLRTLIYENRAVTHIPALAPGITIHPQNTVAAPGSAVTFSIAAFGSQPLGYQWRRDSAPRRVR